MPDMTIGELIRHHRKAKGLTQKKLSETAGVAEVTIIYYESGKFKPKPQQLKKLSDALGVPISDFIDLY